MVAYEGENETKRSTQGVQVSMRVKEGGALSSVILTIIIYKLRSAYPIPCYLSPSPR